MFPALRKCKSQHSSRERAHSGVPKVHPLHTSSPASYLECILVLHSRLHGFLQLFQPLLPRLVEVFPRVVHLRNTGLPTELVRLLKQSSHLILSGGEAAGSPHLIDALLHFWLLSLATGEDEVGAEEADELQLFVQPVCLLLDGLQRHSHRRKTFMIKPSPKVAPGARGSFLLRGPAPWPTAQLQTPRSR